MEIKNKKLTRAKIQLQQEKPFFAYLIMNMKFTEKKDIDSIGVDSFGNCYYNDDFINKLSENEIKGVLAHEVLHIVLEHLDRSENLNHQLYNVSADLCVNDMLIENDFYLYSGVLIPRYHNYTFNNSDGTEIVVEDINKKTANQIYEELLKQIKDDKKAQNGLEEKRFDEHIKGKKNLSKEQKREIKNKWKQAVSEASAYARQKGNLPDGLGIFIDGLLNEKVNWKTLLYKYLTRTIPHDYSYNRPSKRSFASGVYLPIMKREAIEIVVSLDTSGSIQNGELKEFMSEINGIAKSFNNLSMKLIVCDSEIKDIYTIGNGDSDEIGKLRIRGGGGTSHKPVYDYINENLPNTRLLVNFTDGYTDLDSLDETINTLWVICKNGINEKSIPFGEVIKLN